LNTPNSINFFLTKVAVEIFPKIYFMKKWKTEFDACMVVFVTSELKRERTVLFPLGGLVMNTFANVNF